MAAACRTVHEILEMYGELDAHLEQLDLLMLAKQELGGFAPVRRMFPAVLDQAGRVSVNLKAEHELIWLSRPLQAAAAISFYEIHVPSNSSHT